MLGNFRGTETAAASELSFRSELSSVHWEVRFRELLEGLGSGVTRRETMAIFSAFDEGNVEREPLWL
jgi:hypothetical protein